MTNKKNNKANHKQNQKNDMRTPDGRGGNKKIPSTVENLDGKVID